MQNIKNNSFVFQTPRRWPAPTFAPPRRRRRQKQIAWLGTGAGKTARVVDFERRNPHAMYCQPLTVRVEPVMKLASWLARNTTQRAGRGSAEGLADSDQSIT